MIDKNEIIQGLQDIVDQKTSDGFVDGVNKQLISSTLALLNEQESLLEDYHKADGFLTLHGWWSKDRR